jgi:hypothetical protein
MVVWSRVGLGKTGPGESCRAVAQEAQGLPRRLDRVVTVPAQLDVDAAAIVDLAQRPQHRRKINVSFTEHEMIVNPPFHVLDVDVPELILPCLDVIGNWHFSQAMQVADVQRQSEQGMINASSQLSVASHGINEHARLRLERQPHAAPRRLVTQSPATIDQAFHQDVLGCGGVGAAQGRLVLAPRIEEESRPRLNDAAEPQLVQQPPHLGQLPPERGVERVEGMNVERQGHTAIAQLGEDAQRVLEAVVSKTIRVVAKAEHIC